MRPGWFLVLLLAVLGCGPSAEEKAKMQEMKAFLIKVVKAEEEYNQKNQTYSLNIKELYHYDSSLESPPAGYKLKGGGGLALAFGFQVWLLPLESGPSYYVNQSGIVRYSTWGEADESSKPVE